MVDAFHTNPIDAYAPRWFRVGPIEVAYLWDARAELFARMSQHDARTWCQIHGARLPTVAEIDAIRLAATRLLVPVTLPTRAMVDAEGVNAKDPIAINAFRSRCMAERAWSEEHDRQVAAQGVKGPDPGELVFNLGKHWTKEDGVEKGWYVPNRALYGGREGPGYVQGGTKATHGTDQIDYSRIALVVRDVRPSWFDRLKEETDEILDAVARRYRAFGSVAPVADGLGARAVAWSQTRIGLHEIPGPVHEVEIVAWGKLCRRGGVYLGRAIDAAVAGLVDLWTAGAVLVSAANDEEAWCAKFASAALAEALEVGEAPPHGLRVSVAELVRDARALGSWRDVSTGYRPRVGDLAIFARAGADPRTGGTGHVARVVVAPSILGEYMTIGGNESPGPGQVHRTARTLGDPNLVGWIAYP